MTSDSTPRPAGPGARAPVAVLLATTLLGACAAPPPIRIGLAGPLSDTAGVPMRLAAELAIAELNASGGVDGRRFELTVEEDFGIPDSAIAVAGRLRASPAIAVVGHLGSATTVAAAAVYGEGPDPMPVLSPSASDAAVTRLGAHVLRMGPSDLAHGAALARFVRTSLGLDRASVVYRNDGYGRGVAGAFAMTFTRSGGELGGRYPFLDPARDLAPYLELLARDPAGQALVLATDRDAARQFLAGARARGLAGPVVGGSALEGIEADGALAEGMHLSVDWLPDGATAEARRFLAAWTAAYPDRGLPTQPAAATYDAIHLVARALAAGAGDRAALLSALRAIGTDTPAVEGVTGQLGFTAEGQPLREAVTIAVVRNGALDRAAVR